MMDADQSAALRAKFPPAVVGKLPKGGTQLDYVGHAAVTDRLLTVDPNWTWEPLAYGPDGLPALDSARNLWIKLTVCGVTRLGVGDGRNAKEVVGDALRNAAMRFGVALDLWSKDELESTLDHPELQSKPRPAQQAPANPAAVPVETGELMTPKTRAHLFALFAERGIEDRDQQLRGIRSVTGREIQSRAELTEAEALRVIASLRGAA